MPDNDRDTEELGFEEALAELEQIVEELEGGQVELERMLDRFERAMALRKHCAALLSEAETRIEQLVDEEGTTEPFSAGDIDADQA
ncbi:MAG: exodeoxyribonuclease VII small subunit [Armatimonadota bacterium]|jgi:exodeoxyribonuclease VII small subunit